jgi:pre-mRNA-processing factor 40
MYLTLCGPPLQVDSEWRKVSKKLEGEDAFEDLDKVERLEVFQVRVGG